MAIAVWVGLDWLLRYRIKSAWLVLSGAAIGWTVFTWRLAALGLAGAILSFAGVNELLVLLATGIVTGLGQAFIRQRAAEN